MDFRDLRPDLCRHINRPDQPERIRPRCDVVRWDDSDTVSIEHMTRAEAVRLYELARHDIHLFGLTWALGTMLGYDTEDSAA